ncbi:MAG: transcriptional repressor [bacterium]
MDNQRYSRQREAVKNYVITSMSHPTAEEVYDALRKIHPNISLGTVYRNLNLLVEMNELIKLTTKSGSVRFDGNTNEHCHFICSCCGHVNDIHDSSLLLLHDKISSLVDGEIHNQELNFYGLCSKCSK